MKSLRQECRAAPGRMARAFTMIELLMVVSILCVLVALLVPTIRIAVGRTDSVKCMNNLRSIGQGMLLYAADRGAFPYSSHYDWWTDWGENILPYLETKGKYVWHGVDPGDWPNGLWQETTSGSWVDHDYSQNKYNYFTCPSGLPPYPAASFKYPHNYSCNEFLMPVNQRSYFLDWTGAGTPIRPIPQVKPATLKRPGSLILVCDSGVMEYTSNKGDGSDTCYQFTVVVQNAFVASPTGEIANGYTACTTPAANDGDFTTGAGAGYPIYTRHKGRCNALMADGHVQAFANGEIKRRNWAGPNSWCKDWGGSNRLLKFGYP